MSDRPSQRRRRGYGRSAQISTSTSSLSTDATKRKKFALQQRQFISVDSTDDEYNIGSLESNEYSGSSSLSSIDLVKSKSGSRDFFRRVHSDLGKTSRNRRRPNYSAYDFESENIHPNVIFNEANSIDLLLPPSKNKKLRHAPTQRKKSYESEALLALSPPNLRKRKVIRSKSLTLDIHRSPEPLTRSSSLKFQSGRHSPAFSNASSASSFSSIAKTGVPGWQKSFLDRASENFANRENSSAIEAHYSDHDTVDTSTTPCPNNELKPDIFSPPSFSGSIAFHSNLQSPATPERSSKYERRDSSRKRGVCESPSVSLEDMNLSFPSAHRLNRVRDTSLSRSSRSRSRMFQKSNETDSSDLSSIFKSQETIQKKPTNLYEIRNSKSVESDNDEESNVGERSDDDMKHISACSSGDLSYTIHNDQSSEIQYKSPEDTDTSNFNATISRLISPRGHQQMKRLNIEPNEIPSSRDLEYIVQYLRKIKSSKGRASFGAGKTWTVVASTGWSPSRKASFLTWATNGLGFCLRPAGCGISYLLTTKDRGLVVLENLEKILSKLKSNSVKEKRGMQNIEMDACNLSDSDQIPLDLRPSHNTRDNRKGKAKSDDKIPSFFPITSSNVMRSMKKSKKKPSIDKVKVSPSDRNIEVELLRGLDNLDLNAIDAEDEVVEISSFQSSIQEDSSSLTRMVTLEDDKHSNDLAKSSRLSISPRETNMIINRKPRHSGEYVAGSQDLLMHCHGISPQCTSDRPRPNRLNISNAFTPNCHPDILSPCTIDTQKTYSNVKPNFGLMDVVYANEKIETPMPTGCARSWGSRPIPGKDWGLSNECDSTVMSILIQRLEEKSVEYNSFQSNQYVAHANPECYVDPNIKAIVASTADLGFDQEFIHEESDTISSRERRHSISKDLWDEPLNVCDAKKSLNDCSTDVKLNQSEVYRDVFYQENPKAKSPYEEKRKIKSLAKHRRVSLCTSLPDNNNGQNLFEKANFFSSEHHIQTGSSPIQGSIASAYSCTQICSPFFPKMMIDSPPCKYARRFPGTKVHDCLMDHEVLCEVFSNLDEKNLFCQVSLVCSKWANAATSALASLATAGLGYRQISCDESEPFFDECEGTPHATRCAVLEKSWSWLIRKFPVGSFLSEGAFKEVFRVWNSDAEGEEAVSVMDIDLIESTGNKHIIGAELSISILLSSLARRSICPNFVIIRGLFICPHKLPSPQWTEVQNERKSHSENNQSNQEEIFDESSNNSRSMYQYIRMELCKLGDVETFINKEPGKVIHPTEARVLLFQMAFALHTAGDRFGLKHYDVKLLNFFLQSANKQNLGKASNSYTTLRYGFGAHVFSLRLPSSRAYIAKLADYGTSKLQYESDGQPVTLGQFTTIENSPPEFMIRGDSATQGYGHDCFGLGLCMLHLFTGHGPYEEILDEVKCPPLLKKALRKIWENNDSIGYDVIKSVILADVYEDENGHLEGTPDEVLYDTLYRYVVLFGIPKNKSQGKNRGKIWRAISSLTNKRLGSANALQYKRDCKKFSFLEGNDPRIVVARKNLENMKGGINLLLGLTSFDPDKRWTPLDVINSTFMESLRENPQDNHFYRDDIVHSFMAYKTHTMLSS